MLNEGLHTKHVSILNLMLSWVIFRICRTTEQKHLSHATQRYSQDRGISIQAYSPLASGQLQLLRDPLLLEVPLQMDGDRCWESKTILELTTP